MTTKFTAATTYTNVVTTELNALADDTPALGSALSNDADTSTELQMLANFKIELPTTGSRTTSPQVSLLLVPDDGAGTYSDAATLETAGNHIARYADGTAVTFALDAGTTARTFVAVGVQLPNSNFKPGLLNEADAALAATLNIISMSGRYGVDDA